LNCGAQSDIAFLKAGEQEEKAMEGLKSKSAYIVTGTTRGVGKALAGEIARRGHLLFSISSAPESQTEGGRNLHCDLCSPTQVDRAIAALAQAIPYHSIQRLVLINNAGVLGPIGPLAHHDREQIDALLRVNLVAPVSLMAAVIRISSSFTGKRGIINISSGAAHHPYAGWSLYCASKAALEMVTACAALEQRASEHPVYIAAVAPGVVETGMQEEIRNSRASDFPMRSKFIDLQKKGHLTTPAKVAELLIDLDSDGQFEPGGIFDLRDVVWKGRLPEIAPRSETR
jgi:NAD(P)-dependent dehydrogenase (short-subunit alcohol dehydrogenase family)